MFNFKKMTIMGDSRRGTYHDYRVKHVTFLRGIIGQTQPPYYSIETMYNNFFWDIWPIVLGRYIQDGVTEILVSGNQSGRFLKKIMKSQGIDKKATILIAGDMSRFVSIMSDANYYYSQFMTCQCLLKTGLSCIPHHCPEKRAIVTYLHVNKFLE